MSGQEAMSRPIGWWLKEADRRIEAAFDDALRGTGWNRCGGGWPTRFRRRTTWP